MRYALVLLVSLLIIKNVNTQNFKIIFHIKTLRRQFQKKTFNISEQQKYSSMCLRM